MATAHSAVVGNSTKPQSSNYGAAPLLARPSSSRSPEGFATAVSPRINNFQGQGIRTFTSTVHASRRSILPPLGTLALIGGVMLFLGNSTVEAFNFPFSSGKSTPASRMKERLEKHGFVEKLVVPDGNCQMRALADQIHGDEKYHNDVRSKIMSWLSNNEKYKVDDSGTTTLGDFIDRDQYPKWMSYVSYMSRNGSWGDHITLVAASEVYGVKIGIISNVEDHGAGQYLTYILPRNIKPTKSVNLSHWHEMHYNSLHPDGKPRAESVGGREL